MTQQNDRNIVVNTNNLQEKVQTLGNLVSSMFLQAEVSMMFNATSENWRLIFDDFVFVKCYENIEVYDVRIKHT